MPTQAKADLEAAVRQFKDWRSHKKYRYERTPEQLWQLAEELTANYPSARVASKLGINHSQLKKRCNAVDGQPTQAIAPVDFVEALLPPVSVEAAPACEHIELERADGSRMRLRAPEDRPFDLHTIMTSFLGGGHASSNGAH